MISHYVPDIAKIVEGALDGDTRKMFAYAEHLAKKLEKNGEGDSAQRIRGTLTGTPGRTAALMRIGSTQQAVPSMPVDSDSGIPLADEELIAKDRVDVFLAPDVEEIATKLVAYFRAAHQLESHGVGLVPSLLMFGPPGCGKTMLARRIASVLELPLITARTDGLISSYLGNTAKNLRMLFDHAMSHPCVLFLDEFDALAKMRDDDKELGELKRVVISLLQNIDAMGPDHVLLAATNHEHLLDTAIWRRFSYKVQLNLPTSDARAKLFGRFLATFATPETIAILSEMSDGMTGSQIRDIAMDAVREAVINHRTTMKAADVVASVVQAKSNTPIGIEDAIRAVKARNPKCRQAVLAEIFEMSQPRISQILKKGSNGRKPARRTSADQSSVSK